MITNPWVNRITVLVVMFAIYAAGYAGGRDAAVQAFTTIIPLAIPTSSHERI
jgi:hypothetical protein